MSDFTLEALKRYLVMQLIESSSMQNSKELMTDINANALQTAQTMKDINAMFGSNQPPQQQNNNPLSGSNPFITPQQQQNNSNEEMIQFVNETRNNITQMKNEMNDLKAQIFEGLQNLYQGLNQLAANLNQKGK